ncbi:Crp/Fnr family transcriptional regulator [Rhizobium sp. L80/93]|uniref:Crp/Fnr family transcriptional regulator n=1 Tax=unclassified Rhizobium TaxID=2613769 RepID=UPI001AD9C572|nr:MULTISPECIES: Crp/Fnr family transcriptional regulator [unclassified Rhizobium]MBO9171916.1 Crp/Fnr family transcriptional regulator [Rhizobium sp. L245/93]MBO9186425.1 Crp/Fnr family transcriptional regulator [Rhizobium sp. E27B/91]QYA04033.1 Crp/Fnr family transcriptional regulator [Rhizobium sp. B21/90]
MNPPPQAQVRNLLLRAASPDAYALIAPHMRFVELPLRFTLVERDEPSATICFLESGLASVVAVTTEDEMVEVGHIGFEGAAGVHRALHTDRSPTKTFMQGEGAGYLVPASVMRSTLDTRPEFQALVLKYLHSFTIQVSYTALANARFSIYERLSRWLLMCQDRLGDDLGLTHQFLSIMLGVRRSGITDQLHLLEGIGAIKSTRGNIQILNRAKLKDIAGGSYGVAEQEYQRLIGVPLRYR